MIFDINKIKAIEDFNEDCLDLENYINGISSKIIQTFQSNENSCIGIVGKWGDGKTSAINLCLLKLKEYYSMHKKFDCFSVLVLVLIFILPIKLLFLHMHSIVDYMTNLFTPILDYDMLSSLWLVSVLCLLCGWKSYKNFISRIGKLLLKCIYKYAYKNQLVVIKFSPWNCSNSQQMVKEYLKLLSNELEIIESDISVKLLTYAKLISDNKFTNIMCVFATNQDISTLKQDIAQKLKESNKKVIVVVDDFDRISSFEIFNTLKVIGTIADFPNLINIVAYDKQYIGENLKSYFESKGEIIDAHKYLQKIIPLEFPLPKISYKKIFDIFIDELKKIIKDSPHNEKELHNFYMNSLGGYLRNIRDLKQFLNAFKFHYDIFSERGVHININDLLFITALKTFNFTLWNNVYLLGKNYFSSSIGFGSYINTISNDTKFSDCADKILGFTNLTDYELNILVSLIPYIRKDVRPNLNFIEDFYCYDIKRFWSGRETFNLYFEFNPPESHSAEILELLKEEIFQNKKLNMLLDSDIGLSDLRDIMYARQYSNHINNVVVINYIKIIAQYYENMQMDKKFIEMKRRDAKLFDKLGVNDIEKLIFDLISDKKTNINALIELIYAYFLHKKDAHLISDIIYPNEELKTTLSQILSKFKEILRNIDIKQLYFHSFYYLCTALALVDTEIKDIIQEKIRDVVTYYSAEDLLFFLNKFMFETSPNFYSMDILNEKNVFNDDIIKTLKSKLLLLQDNEDIMQNSQYICIFTSGQDLPSKKVKPQHIVDYILQNLYKDI